MKRYRVRSHSLTGKSPSRAALLQAIELQDHVTHALAVVAGEPLFELPDLDAVLRAMGLERADVEEA